MEPKDKLVPPNYNEICDDLLKKLDDDYIATQNAEMPNEQYQQLVNDDEFGEFQQETPISQTEKHDDNTYASGTINKTSLKEEEKTDDVKETKPITESIIEKEKLIFTPACRNFVISKENADRIKACMGKLNLADPTWYKKDCTSKELADKVIKNK